MAKTEKEKFKNIGKEYKRLDLEITSDLIAEYVEKWNHVRGGRFPIVDEFLTEIFHDPRYEPDFNAHYVDRKYFYMRTYLIDGIYGTQLKEGFNSMVENLCKKSVYDRIYAGDTSVIDEIKNVKSNVADDGTKDVVSFCSKYCFRMNKEAFPIFDKVVKDLLVAINHKEHFYSTKDIKKCNMANSYAYYKEVMDKFIEVYGHLFPNGVVNYDYADRFLWVLGKTLEGSIK